MSVNVINVSDEIIECTEYQDSCSIDKIDHMDLSDMDFNDNDEWYSSLSICFIILYIIK
jgi:hypothetical protein